MSNVAWTVVLADLYRLEHRQLAQLMSLAWAAAAAAADESTLSNMAINACDPTGICWHLYYAGVPVPEGVVRLLHEGAHVAAPPWAPPTFIVKG